MRGDVGLGAVVALIGMAVLLDQCSKPPGADGLSARARPEIAGSRAAQDGNSDELEAAQRRWTVAAEACASGDDEVRRAQNCALRRQAERELNRQGLCRLNEDWAPCGEAPVLD